MENGTPVLLRPRAIISSLDNRSCIFFLVTINELFRHPRRSRSINQGGNEAVDRWANAAERMI